MGKVKDFVRRRILQPIENVKAELGEAIRGGSAGQIAEEISGKPYQPIKPGAGKVEGFVSERDVEGGGIRVVRGGGGGGELPPTKVSQKELPPEPPPEPPPRETTFQRNQRGRELSRLKGERGSKIEFERRQRQERERLGISPSAEFGATGYEREYIKQQERIKKSQESNYSVKELKNGKWVEVKSKEITPSISKAGGGTTVVIQIPQKKITVDSAVEKEKKSNTIFDVPKFFRKIRQTNVPFIDKPLWAIGKDTVKTKFIIIDGKRILVEDKKIINEPPLPEFKKETTQTKGTIIAMPVWNTNLPEPNVISKDISSSEKNKMAFGSAFLNIRKTWGEIFETNPSMEPLTTRKVTAEVSRKTLITVPEGVGYFTGEGAARISPSGDLVTPRTTIPTKVSYLQPPPPPKELKFFDTQKEPFKVFEEKRESLPTVSREIGELAGTLGTYTIIPPPVFLAGGLAIVTAPKGVVTTQERIEGGMLAGFGVLGVAGKFGGKVINKAASKGFSNPFRTITVEEEILNPKTYKSISQVSQPRGRASVTLPSGRQASIESYDLLGEGVASSSGRKVIVTTPVRKFFNMKPIYKGTPYGKVGSKGYKKAVEELSKTQLTTTQAKELIKLTKPKLQPIAFSGKGSIIEGLSEQPIAITKGVMITYKPKLQIGGFKTAGGKTKLDFIKSSGEKIELKGGKADIEYIQKLSEEYNPLGQLGKKTKRFKEVSGIKYVGEKAPRTIAEQKFFGESITGYVEKGIIKPISPGGKVRVGETSKVYVGSGEPKFKLESDPPFRTSKEVSIKSTIPKEPVDMYFSPSVSKQIVQTLERVYGKPTPAQINAARIELGTQILPKLKTKPTFIKPISIPIESKSIKTPSIYEGKGTYERYSPSELVYIDQTKITNLDLSAATLGESKFKGSAPQGNIKGGLGESKFGDLGVLGSRLDSSTKQKELLKNDLGLKTNQQTKQAQQQQLKERIKEETKQREEQLYKQLTAQKLAQESLQRYKQNYLLSEQQLKRTRIPPKPKIKIPPIIKLGDKSIAQRLSKKLEEEPGLFKVFAFKSEKPFKIGETKSKQEAKELLIGRLRTTLRASGYIEKNKKKLRFSELGYLGEDFRPSRVSPFRVTQKKSRRLGRRQETTELQYFRKVSKGKGGLL